MKPLLTTIALPLAVPAAAQTQPNPGVAAVNGNLQSGGPAFPLDPAVAAPMGSQDTPTMRRQRLVWAAALHDRARRFQAEDGGVLSDRHARYLRRRIDRLLLE